jgi:hypothetical protein
MFGVDRFDAILPPGQGSILAIGASASSGGNGRWVDGCAATDAGQYYLTTESSTVLLLPPFCKIWRSLLKQMPNL